MDLSKGFFDLTEEYIGESTPNCSSCHMDTKCNTPRMKVSGKGRKGVFILAEASGKTEDTQGIQLVGEAGSLLRNNLKKLGLDLDRDFWKMNSCSCRPIDSKGNNRKPTPKEVTYCRPFWRTQRQELEPQFIFLFGSVALSSFYGDRKSGAFSKLSISSWRKRCIPDPIVKAWVIPLLHPSYVLNNKDHEHIFKRDLEWAVSQLDRSKPEFPEYTVEVLHDFDDIVTILKKHILANIPIAIDYESNALRPYYKASKLLTIGFSSGIGTFAFPYQWQQFWSAEQLATLKTLYTKMLKTNRIIVQSLPMEESWNKIHFGDFRSRYLWDTQVTTHVLDERDGVTGLKKQTYFNFGVYGYDDDVSQYIKSGKGTHFNKMEQAPLHKVLKYNGLDAKFTLMLWELQKQELKGNKGLTEANDFFLDGIIDLLDMEVEGIQLDIPHYEVQTKLLSQSIEESKELIQEMDEVQVFKKKTGRDLDIASGKDLQILLFDIMGLQEKSKATKTGFAVDEATLKAIDVPFTQEIINMRKTKKTKDFVDNFIFMADEDGKIHPMQNLHLAATYRSSSSSPNLHQIPKRSEEAKKIIRAGIIAPPGKQILEVDYGAMEVRIWACYTKDPVLMDYLWQDHDMHKEWGEYFKVPRGRAKNLFVFPLIYGSYYVSITRGFQEDGFTHLTEDWVQKGEKQFWDKYKACRTWQDGVIEEYKKTGEVNTHFGFLRRDLLTRNQIVNYPIQATAFHCLLWSSMRISAIMRAEKWKTTKIGQIHDALLFYLDPDEKEHVMETVERVMTQEIADEFKWINVPLLSEFSISAVGGNWAEMEDIKKEKE